jgi:hypothetical protein
MNVLGLAVAVRWSHLLAKDKFNKTAPIFYIEMFVPILLRHSSFRPFAHMSPPLKKLDLNPLKRL